MSTDTNADATAQSNEVSSFQRDLNRVAGISSAAFQSIGANKEAYDRVRSHVQEMNELLDDQEIPHNERVAAAWFFILQFHS